MYGAKPVIRSSSPVRGGAFACCGYLVLDGFAGVCEVWIFPGESLWDGEGPQARRCAASPPRASPAKAARRAAWPAAQACALAAICPVWKWIFITLLNGRGILAQQKAGGARRYIAGTGPIRDPDIRPANKRAESGTQKYIAKGAVPCYDKGQNHLKMRGEEPPCPKRRES